ncbi:MAG: valine--tRNA ligase [Bradymonadales bacterium]
MLEKSYMPGQVEGRWYEFWMQRGLFKADEHSEKPPFCIVIPPPNVTGKLHMGHALFVTIQDLLIRFKRMQGYEALWLPGSDHAGIATQVMVERALAQEGKSRLELGREEFLRHVWAWKEEKGGSIIEQLKLLGASCDWERERFTMDAGLSRAVAEAFVRLYEEGLIYRDERLVNWDPVAQTVLSDLEIDQNLEEGNLWHIKYVLEGSEEAIVIATTRPETLFGDMAVAVHPDDERYKHMIGRRVALPLCDRYIPVIADGELAQPEFGTGAVKVTPAHDFNDFECGKRHDLPRLQVIDLYARMNDNVPEPYRGLTREQAREKAVADLEELGLLLSVTPHSYAPSRSQRSGVMVEPLLLPQWWVNAGVLAKPAIEAVQSGKTRMIPKLWEKTYFNWMHNIRDWCISRQLWWGHQIPAWYCEDCSQGHIHRIHKEGEHDADLRVDAEAKPIVSRERPEACPSCGGANLTRDPDVLDTWFSSGLWPFSTLGWPDDTASLRKFYPTQVMETAADIIFFWVARMMMFGIHFMGETPFKDVYFHALVRDKHGQKMSKTKGNVIDPLLLIYGCRPEDVPEDERLASMQLFDDYPEGVDAQGADALRFSLTMLAAQGRDVRLDIRRIEGYRAFLNKLWQASRFVFMNIEGHETRAKLSQGVEGLCFALDGLSFIDAWILDALETCVVEVTRHLEEFSFNDAAQCIYEFLWNSYCDWYIELAKTVLYDKSEGAEKAQESTRCVLLYVLETVLRLLHPFAPFITEEIWQALPKAEGAPESIMIAPWPESVPERLNAKARAQTQTLIAIVAAVRQIRGEANISPSKAIPSAIFLIDDAEKQAILRETAAAIRSLAKIEDFDIAASDVEKPKACAVAVADGIEVVIPLAGLIDIDEELARLDKNIAKLKKDIESSTKKLSNPNFVQRAKPEVVATERERVERHTLELEKLQEAKERLL